MRHRVSLVTSLILVSSALASCSSKSDNHYTFTSKTITETTDSNGLTEAAYDPTAGTTQDIVVNALNLPTSNVKLSLPQGTLAVSTSIFIEQGTPVLSSVSDALGIAGTVTPQSASVVIRSSDNTIIPALPLKITMPLSSPALNLTDSSLLVVLYVVWTADGIKAGLIAPDQIKLANGTATFSSSYFGQFQLANIAALPTTTVVVSKTTILPKSDALKPQAFYQAGMKANQAGYWKNETWTALTNGNAGNTEAHSITFSALDDMYVAGLINANYEGGTPGYWKNGSWVVLPFPTGKTRCGYLHIAVGSNGVVHQTGYCNANEFDGTVTSSTPYVAAYWKDGVVSVLPTLGEKFDFVVPDSLSVDSNQNVFVTAYQAASEDAEEHAGLWKNGVWRELTTGTDLKPSSLTRPFVTKTGKEYILGYNESNSGITSGYWLDNVWVPSTTGITDMFLSSGDDLYFSATQADQIGYLKNTTFTAVTRPTLPNANDGFYLGRIVASTSGDVYLQGHAADFDQTFNTLYGYFKNGTWVELGRSSGTVSDGPLGVTIH